MAFQSAATGVRDFFQRARSTHPVILKFVLYQFLFSMLFWAPIFYEFQRSIGIEDSDIFKIQSHYYILFCFLEIPTGWFADRFGYKESMIGSAVVLLLSQLVAVLFLSYWGQWWHFMLVGLARSFNSGASSSYLFEWLDQSGRRDEYKKFEGAARSVTLVGRVICYALISLIYTSAPTSPFIATGLFAGLALIVVLTLPHVQSRVVDVVKPSLLHGVRAFRQSPPLIFVMLLGITAFVVSRVVTVNLFNPILNQVGFPVSTFGILLGVFSLFEAYGAARPQIIASRMEGIHSLFLLSLVLCLIQLALVFVTGPTGLAMIVAIVLFVVYFLSCGFYYPIQKQIINECITESEMRATLLSLESLVDRMVSAFSIVVLEYFARHALRTQFKLGDKTLSLDANQNYLMWSALVFILFLGVLWLTRNRWSMPHSTD